MGKQMVQGQILIECPNTIFHLYVTSEDEISRIEIFMNNIRSLKNMKLTDIYNWCNRQGIEYDTEFNFHRELSLWNNIRFYYNYVTQKRKYQLGYSMA